MTSEVSRRYAKALYDLASSKGLAERVYSELVALNEAFNKDKDSHEFILSPIVFEEKKLQAIAAVTGGFSEEVKSFMLLLVEKKRIEFFSEIVASYRDISDASLGKTRGVVRSASKLNDDEKRKLEVKINKTINKEVILTFEEDKNLLGGLVAQVGGWTFNDTLESHLTRISEDLHRRSN